jgi:hypothetical protein
MKSLQAEDLKEFLFFTILNCNGFYQIICILHNSSLLHFKHIQINKFRLPNLKHQYSIFNVFHYHENSSINSPGLAFSRAELSTCIRQNLNGSGTHRTLNRFRAKLNLEYA